MRPSNHHRTKITPPDLAALWGVSPDKVLGWIRSGELVATNAAARLGGRPRYLIDQSAVAAFERRRRAATTPAVSRARKADASVIDFF